MIFKGMLITFHNPSFYFIKSIRDQALVQVLFRGVQAVHRHYGMVLRDVNKHGHQDSMWTG